MNRLTAFSAAALILSGAAFAGTDISLPPFTAINAHGGANVVLRHGDVQRVTVVSGDLKKAKLEVVGGKTLDITACTGWCWNTKGFKVEIVSPRIDTIEVHGGSDLDAVGPFPKQPLLNIEAHGGADADTRAIPAEVVNAHAHGGADLDVQALVELNAHAHGGADISYTGNPQRVSSHAHGGGSIEKH